MVGWGSVMDGKVGWIIYGFIGSCGGFGSGGGVFFLGCFVVVCLVGYG